MRKAELSQHFLRSPKLAGFLIGHSNIKKRDTVIDIGAGSGVITAALARRCKQVIAIEPDHETAELLRKHVAKFENVTIVCILL
jgi:23S rRNA (adenine-N6)-dimethyltransferase